MSAQSLSPTLHQDLSILVHAESLKHFYGLIILASLHRLPVNF